MFYDKAQKQAEFEEIEKDSITNMNCAEWTNLNGFSISGSLGPSSAQNLALSGFLYHQDFRALWVQHQGIHSNAYIRQKVWLQLEKQQMPRFMPIKSSWDLHYMPLS
jgi:hypothetical protein